MVVYELDDKVRVSPVEAGGWETAAPADTVGGLPTPAASVPGVSPDGSRQPAPLHFERRSTGWESFRCACGKAIQLGPGFLARSLRCPGCRREIEILGAGARSAPRPGATRRP